MKHQINRLNRLIRWGVINPNDFFSIDLMENRIVLQGFAADMDKYSRFGEYLPTGFDGMEGFVKNGIRFVSCKLS